MPLVSAKEILLDAQKNGYAVGAFNIENMEMAQAVIAAAQAKRAPVLLQTTPGTLRYAPPELFYAMAAALARGADVPVALHLDHGDSFELAQRCVRAGYTSVMIDGSRLPYEDNIALSRRVADLSACENVPTEAELGTVGGKEDGAGGAGDAYTDPALAGDFVSRAGVFSLAVAIGTAHGVYQTTPVLDVARLAQIRRAVDAPLVLHGASGLTSEQVRACISAGICKVNFATELRAAYTRGVCAALKQNPIDPKAYGKAGRSEVQALVEDRMAVCGACGRA